MIQSIQGLRAIAVIAVVVYHASVFWTEAKAFLPGGFLGVDVFFVISGYVITRSLIEAHETGRLTLRAFYQRRIRRLLPALLSMVLVVVAGRSFFVDWSDSLWLFGVMAAFGVSNVGLWLTDDYDSATLQSNPLLHTWSLGVEEQFYVVLSIAFVLMTARSLRRVSFFILVLSVFSLVFNVVWWNQDASMSFYLLFGRFWELGAGVLLALAMKKSAERSERYFGGWEVLSSLFGFGVILYYFFSFELTSKHPGPETLGLILATAVVIWSANANSPVNYVLSTRPFRVIGDSSYSIYLWHWPIAIILSGLPELPVIWKLSSYIGAALALGFLSRRYIELPWLQGRSVSKTKRNSVSRVRATAAVAIMSVLVVAISPTEETVQSSQAIATVASPPSNKVAESSERVTEAFLATFARPDLGDYCEAWSEGLHSERWCEIGDPAGPKSILLVGDSHALSMLDFLDAHLKSRGESGYFGYASGCPALPCLYPNRKKTSQIINCFNASENLQSMIDQSAIKQIWLVNRWDYYIGVGGNLLSDNPEGPFSIEASRELAQSSLSNLILSSKANNIGLHIFDQPPQQIVSPRELNFEEVEESGQFIDSRASWIELNSVSLVEHLEREVFEDSFFDATFALAKAEPRDLLVEIGLIFCDEFRCALGDEQGLYYFDDDHLSIHGVETFFSSTAGESVLRRTFGD